MKTNLNEQMHVSHRHPVQKYISFSKSEKSDLPITEFSVILRHYSFYSFLNPIPEFHAPYIGALYSVY